MAESTLELILRIKKQGSGAKETEKELGSLQSTVKSLGGVMGAIAGSAAAGALVAGLKFSIDAAMESQLVMAATENVIRATGQAAGLTADDIANLSGRLSEISGVEDEVVQGGANLLLTFKEIKGQTFERASASMLDMAVAMNQGSLEGIDLKSTATQLGKALNVQAGDTAGATRAMSALAKQGVSFSKAQKDAAKAAIELNDVAAFQAIILNELEGEFGGAAEAAGNTAAGSFAKLQVAVGNLAEKIGGSLLPTLTKAANAANLLITWNDKTTAAIAEHEKELLKTTKTYKEYLALKAQDYVTTGQLSEGNLRAIELRGAEAAAAQTMIANNTLLSESEYNAARATNGTTEEMRFKIEAYNLAAIAAGELELTEEEYKLQQQGLKAELSALNALINGQLGPTTEDFKNKQADLTAKSAELKDQISELEGKRWLTADQKTQLETMRGELDKNNTAIADNAAAHEDATKRILFGILSQKAAQSGNLEALLPALNALSVQWGLVDQKTADFTTNSMLAFEQLSKNPDAGLPLFLAQMDVMAGQATDNAVTASEQMREVFYKTGHAIGPDLILPIKTVNTELKENQPEAVDKAKLALAGYGTLLTEQNEKEIRDYIIGLSAIEAGFLAIGTAARQVPGLPGGGGIGQPRAHGGPVKAGQMYLVGERGPEPFIPATDGTILPNSSINYGGSLSAGGGKTLILNLTVQAGPLTIVDAVSLETQVLPRLKQMLEAT